jgi:hypothetical protein
VGVVWAAWSRTLRRCGQGGCSVQPGSYSLTAEGERGAHVDGTERSEVHCLCLLTATTASLPSSRTAVTQPMCLPPSMFAAVSKSLPRIMPLCNRCRGTVVSSLAATA